MSVVTVLAWGVVLGWYALLIFGKEY